MFTHRENPNIVYKIAIIDYLQNYNFMKRL